MTVFNMTRFPIAIDSAGADLSSAPRVPASAVEAVNTFQRACERSDGVLADAVSLLRQSVNEASDFLPQNETRAQVGGDRVAATKECPIPTMSRHLPVSETPVGFVPPVSPEAKAEARPVVPATPDTLAKVVEENLTLAKEMPQPLPIPSHPAQVPEHSVDSVPSVSPEAKVESRPVVPATPETLAKVVAENLALAKEMPQPLPIPSRPAPVSEASVDSVPPVSPEAKVEARPVVPATPETLAKVVTENLALAKELPRPLPIPSHPAPVSEASTDFVSPVSPEVKFEFPAVSAKEQQIQCVEVSVDAENLVNAAATRPAPATPETLVKVVTENRTLAKELPQPLSIPTRSTSVSEVSVDFVAPASTEAKFEIPAVSAKEQPIQSAEVSVDVENLVNAAATRPAPATSETLAKVVAENRMLAKEMPQPLPIPSRPVSVAEEMDDSVPQALPETGVAVQTIAPMPVVGMQDETPVAGVAAKISTGVPLAASNIVLEAASAVADALLVSPSLMRGEGEIRVQLKPDVLDGSHLRIQVFGSEMHVEFEPVTEDVARLLTEAHPRLISHLAEKIPSFQFAVTVMPVSLVGRRLARKSVSGEGGES